jgi:hypothetical protein
MKYNCATQQAMGRITKVDYKIKYNPINLPNLPGQDSGIEWLLQGVLFLFLRLLPSRQ